MSTTPRAAPQKSTTVRSDIATEIARTALQMAYMLGDNPGAALAARLFTSPHRHRRPARERAVLAGGHRFTVDVRLTAPVWGRTRRRIAAWRWGAGPAVLLVHGWEGRGSQLGAFVEPLVDAGMGVIAFDAPAHGDSSGRRLYLTDLADAIAAIADRVGPLHAIVAHSFGAAGVLLAGRVHGVTAPRNVFVAPNVVLEDGFFAFTQVFGLGGRERGLLEDRLARHTGVHPATLTPDRLVGDRDDALLVIHDDADPDVALVGGRRLAAAWPGARLITTSGLGHRRILRDPAVIAAAVAFAITHAPTTGDDLRAAIVGAWVDAIDTERRVAAPVTA